MKDSYIGEKYTIHAMTFGNYLYACVYFYYDLSVSYDLESSNPI